jgi:hypothetical protein
MPRVQWPLLSVLGWLAASGKAVRSGEMDASLRIPGDWFVYRYCLFIVLSTCGADLHENVAGMQSLRGLGASALAWGVASALCPVVWMLARGKGQGGRLVTACMVMLLSIGVAWLCATCLFGVDGLP